MALGLGVREGPGLGLGLGSGEHGLRAEEAREHLPISLYLPISPYRGPARRVGARASGGGCPPVARHTIGLGLGLALALG